MSKNESCGDCRYSTPQGNGSDGLWCRRFPPVGQVLQTVNGVDALGRPKMGLQQVASFAPMQPGQWCGEFVPGSKLVLS